MDELSIYRGRSYKVQKHIKIKQPTLGKIEKMGEQKYFSMVHFLSSTPQNHKSLLWDLGIDYTKITPWEFFYNVGYAVYPQEDTKILFGKLDFQKFEAYKKQDTGDVLLYQVLKNGDEVIIDECTYEVIADYLRSVHGYEKDESMPASNKTKMILIEEERDEIMYAQGKEYKSYFKNLISAMVNSEGFKYNWKTVWKMKINAFMDSVARISKIKNVGLLLQSGYSGFGVDLKKINKNELNWMGDLK